LVDWRRHVFTTSDEMKKRKELRERPHAVFTGHQLLAAGLFAASVG